MDATDDSQVHEGPPEAVSPHEAHREAVTMALYVCLVLAAEFALVSDDATSTQVVLAAIWGTTVGLALAHVFAFDLTARLFAGGARRPESRLAAWAQLGAAAAVAVVVSIPFALLRLQAALRLAAFIAVGLIGITAYLAAREAGAGRGRALLDGAIVLGVALLVVSVKVALSAD